MSKHVFAKSSPIIVVDGLRVQLHEGEVWAADDPVVVARPDLFGDVPTKLRRTAPEPAPVEDATAAPGEKRRTRAR